jgi:DNA-binding NarL/FixJ family response regulator
MDFVDDAVSLTPRERDIVTLVAEGQSSKGIARAMNLSHRTVERHLENCRFKLNVRNKAQLVAKAVTDGLVNVSPNDERPALVELRGGPNH